MQPSIEAVMRQRIQSEINSRITTKVASDEAELRSLVESCILHICQTSGLTEEQQQTAFKTFVDDFLQFGPLQKLIDNPEISEIMVNGAGFDLKTGEKLPPRTWVEVDGVIHEDTSIHFDDDAHLMRIIDRIGKKCGRKCDESNPCMDARMPDGARVNAVHPSCSIDGPSLNIRKFRNTKIEPAELVETNCLPKSWMEFLESCVASRVNIIISGGTGSGKTTLLNALASFISNAERVITIEDTAELRLEHPNIVRLQAKLKNSEGAGEKTIHDLLVNSLRMRPDRIVVGECRDKETVDMLQAMQTGHNGSLTTVHANSSRNVFERVEAMVNASCGWPKETTDMQIAAAVDLIVHTARLPSGRRIVESIMAVEGFTDNNISRTELFKFERSVGAPDEGKTAEIVQEGIFVSCARQSPKIKEKILAAGNNYDAMWFYQDEVQP
jgi:pilus assembly protein CpaF